MSAITFPVGTAFQCTTERSLVKASPPFGKWAVEVGAVKKWVGDASGTYDMMNALKKVFILSGNKLLADRFAGYTNLTALPHLFFAVPKLAESVSTTRHEGLTAHNVSEVVHDTFEVGAMTAFSLSIFSKNSQPLANAGVVLNGIGDVADIGIFVTDLKQAKECQAQALKETHSTDRLEAIKARVHYSILKVAKTVTAAVSSFFACWVLFMGAPLISPVIATVVSLSSSLFSTAAFFQKNLADNYVTKIA